MMGCSRAYTQCRGDLDAGQMAREGCKKKCKDTKTMTALKSCKKSGWYGGGSQATLGSTHWNTLNYYYVLLKHHLIQH